MFDLFSVFFDNLGLSKEQRIFLMRTGWVTFVSVHIFWVCGWMAFAGFSSPFANGQEVQNISKQLKEDRLDRLQSQILQIRYSQCRTTMDSPARIQYTDRLNEVYNKYLQSSGGLPPRVPNCDQT